MNQINKQTFVKGALILTVAAFISKVLSALYRVPLQNLSGDFGFYVYQQIYPFIGLVMILSLYSFPTAISILSATMLEKKEGKLSLYSFYFPVFIILFIINGVLFLTLLLFSKKLSALIGDTHLANAFYTLSFAFLLIPFVSLFRGVFQSYGNMRPTAYSQIIDQLVRVTIIVMTAFWIYYNDWSIYAIGQFGALATIIGLISAFSFLLFTFIKDRPYTRVKHVIPWRNYVRTLIIFGFAASLNHIVLLMIQFADVLTLVPLLMEYGFSSYQAKEMKGIFDRGQPLIQFGTVIGSSFALALIPAISTKDINTKSVLDALLVSFYIAGGATVGLIILMPEANVLLFQNSVETTSLRLLVSSILLSSIVITVNALLQSFGLVMRTAFYILLVLCIKWVLNIMLVPLWGLVGSALATVLSLGVLCSIGLIELRRKLPQLNFMYVIKWRLFSLSIGSMIIYLSVFKLILPISLFQSRVLLLIYVCFLVISGALIYLTLLIRLNVLSKQQIKALPKSHLLMKLRRDS